MYDQFYRSLYRIRRIEEEVARIYPTDKIKSPVHLSIGQEAVAVGVCEALRPQDIVFGTYRSHAIYLAKGGSAKAMMAELYGKATGCAKGKGGSMHLIDTEHGVMGTSAVVGTTVPNAVGYAYAMKLKKQDVVVVSFMGDGATDEGVFHESLNFAALKKLPIIFVCENNQYAIHTHQALRQAKTNIAEKAETYGMVSKKIEDNDVMDVYENMKDAVGKIKSGEGPFFFECMTYRWKEHVGPNEDFQLGFRSEEEAEPWIKNDPQEKLSKQLDVSVREEIQNEVEAEILEAITFAEESPFPKPEELFSHVFKED